MELNQKTPLALDFKSATLYAVRVVLQTHDMAQLQLALAQRMHDAGSFFKDEPVVIDAGELDDVVDWTALVALLRSHDLHPIAAVAAGDNVDAALDAGLTNVELSAPVARPGSQPADDKDVPAVAAPPEGSAGTAADTSASQTKPKTGNGKPAASTGRQAGHSGQRAAEVAQASVPAVAPAALVINRQLRSGQRIYARDTDLIVIGMVSQGAEVIADGNVHVYGPLRGKAMAGARGDATARIFTTQLDPELVAIAGVYRVIETRLDDSLLNQPTVIQRDGDSLQMVALGK